MEKEALAQYIAQRTIFWGSQLELEHWEIQSCFEELSESEKNLAWAKTAETFVHWPYQKALIIYYYENLTTEEPGEIDQVIIHELTHLLVAEMTAKQDRVNHEERVTSSLTRILVKMFRRLGDLES